MKKKVYAYLHTHWDREWYRDKEDFNLRLLDVFDIVLDELENKRAPFFYFDGQSIALSDYLKYREEKAPLIKKLIKERKLAIGPYYASIDSFLVNYCFMLKNLDFGLEISEKFGQKDFIGYMCDIFGISKSAFESLKEKNINKALIWRGVNPKKINNCCDFKYQNINTSWLVQGYFNDFFNGKIEIKNIENLLEKINKYSQNSILLPIGADHLGILKDANEKIKKINKQLKNYEIILTSPFEYFKNTSFKNITKEFEFLDNSATYILNGCLSSRIYQKTKNVILENNLTKKIELLNHYLNYNYQKNIDFVYKTLIKCHAHDGICACSIDSVHKTIDYRQLKSENIINSLEKNIIAKFKKENKISDAVSDKIGIFNLTNRENLNVVKIKTPYPIKNAQIIKKEKHFPDEILTDIYKIPVTEQITTIYTQLVQIDNSKKLSYSVKSVKEPETSVKVTDSSIENNFIKLQIKNKKVLITDKILKEKINFKLTDIKDFGDSYNFAPEGEYKEIEPVNSKILEKGSIRSALRLNYKNIKLDVYLDNCSKYLRFQSTVNNKQKNHKIQAVFILKENINKTTAQDAYGIIERNIDCNYKMPDFMPAVRPVEVKTNIFPMQSFVNFKNYSILTKGLHEYEVYKNELRICLLRSTGTISNPRNKARFIPAGPNLETPQLQCLKETQQEFAFMFGDYKDCFNNLDIFFENYIAFGGDFKKNQEIIFDKIKENEYLYGINNKKKILFNYR